MLYAIENRAGRVLCHQYASNPKCAVEFARMYGHRGAFHATVVQGR